MDAGDWGLEGKPKWWWKLVRPADLEIIPLAETGIQGVTSALLSAISMKDVARRMPDGEIQRQLLSRSDAFISELLDDFCGTGPWPWPGPRPWIFPAVAHLNLIASTMNKGEMRDEVQRVADDMAQRAVRE